MLVVIFNEYCFDKQANTTSSITSAEELVGMDITYTLMETNITHSSAPSCDHFGCYGEWKKYLATKILAKVANWQPTDKRETCSRKITNNRTNLIIVRAAASPVFLFFLLVV